MAVDEPELESSEDVHQLDRDFYRYIFQRHPLPAWIYDPETFRFLAVNRAAITEYGYSREEFLDKTVTDLRSEAQAAVAGERNGCGLNAHMQSGWPRHKRKDGSVLAVSTLSHPLLFRGKETILEVVHDISERRRIEQDLRLFAAAVNGATDPVMLTDAGPRPRIVYVNPAFTSMTGYEPEEVTGRSPVLLQGPKSERISLSKIKKDIELSGNGKYQTINYRKEGTEYSCEWQVTPLRDDAGVVTHYLSIQRDVTERTRLLEQFQQSQKMEAVGRLAGGIAHDFNNLLTIILGYAGMMSVEIGRMEHPDQRQLRSLHEIHKAAEKAATLTGQLLAFSRKQVTRPRVIDLNPLVENVKGMLHRLIGEDIELDLVLENDLGRVQVDPGQVEQALMNLAVNSRDAMPNGGVLTVETRNAEITPRYAALTSVPPGRYVSLTVTDTGHGMDEATRSKVFEPFFTTKEAGKGTGLGLSMVYGFAKQSGGWVTLYSEIGRGACFKIYLPRTDSVPENESSRAATEAPRGTGFILVVEDEAGIRELTREVLLGAGYEVQTAANAREAIGFAETLNLKIDLLFSDVVLPGVSGPDLAIHLKERHPEMKVLLASGYSDHALLRQGTIESGAAFVQKPFDTDTLLAKISELLTSEATNSGALPN